MTVTTARVILTKANCSQRGGLISTPLIQGVGMAVKNIEPPLSVGAAAVYPYSEELMAWASKTSRYNDAYSLAKVVGVGDSRRIWLPRQLAPSIPVDMRDKGEWVDFDSTFEPRHNEQARVIEESVKLLKMGFNFVAECPTGFGKTYCAMEIIARTRRKTIIVVTKEDIRDQWIDAAKAVLGLTRENGLGLIQGDVCDVAGKSVVIAMIHSVAKDGRYPAHTFQGFGLAIWDEVHRVGADEFSQSCYRIPARLRLGLSATPIRKDGKSSVVEGHIGPVKVQSKQAPSTPKIIRVHSTWNCPVTKVKDEDGEWKVVPIPHTPKSCGHVIRILTRDHQRNLMIRGFILDSYEAGRRILVQSDRKEHLEQISAMLAKAGIPAQDMDYYVGGMTKDARTLAKTKRVILATYQMTAEATDIPELDTLVMCTPKSDVVQIVGRILRAMEGKKQPIVFDIVDDTSPLFSTYAKNRAKWYSSIKAPIFNS